MNLRAYLLPSTLAWLDRAHSPLLLPAMAGYEYAMMQTLPGEIEQLRAERQRKVIDWNDVREGNAARPKVVAAVVADMNPTATKPIPTLENLSAHYGIPPVFVEAEAGTPPPVSAFKKRPAKEIAVNDLLIAYDTVYRVKRIRTSETSIKIRFEAHPVSGGRPETVTLMPYQWIPVYKVVKGKTA